MGQCLFFVITLYQTALGIDNSPPPPPQKKAMLFPEAETLLHRIFIPLQAIGQKLRSNSHIVRGRARLRKGRVRQSVGKFQTWQSAQTILTTGVPFSGDYIVKLPCLALCSDSHCVTPESPIRFLFNTI